MRDPYICVVHPARRVSEKADYTPIPMAGYFKAL
jgi:hypothetical protein